MTEEYKPEILQCDQFSFWPQLDDNGETGRYHMYKSSPIEPIVGRAARYDVSYQGLFEDYVDADKSYRVMQREALQTMVARVDD